MFAVLIVRPTVFRRGDCRAEARRLQPRIRVRARLCDGGGGLGTARPAHPDVTVVDVRLPGRSGIEFVRQSKRQNPDALAVMLTVVEDTDELFESLKARANGYILKSTSLSGILDAIREVVEGGAPMSRAIARKVL
jgi:DNA-binding NarL/FixJ family response regulator